MKKFRFFAALLAMLLVCTSCGYTRNGSGKDGGTAKPQFYDFTSKAFQNSSLKPVEEDKNCYYYKKVKHCSQGEYPFEKHIITVKDSQGHSIDDLRCMDDEYGYYTRNSEKADNFDLPDFKSDKQGEVGIVDYKKNTYRKICDLPQTSQAGILAANAKYMVWKEGLNCSNWGITQYHLYDLTTKKDTVFYIPKRDSDGRNAEDLDETVVIVKDSIYYQKLTYTTDSKQDAKAGDNLYGNQSILAYDIESKTTKTIASKCLGIQKKDNGVMWLQKNADGKHYNIVEFDGNQKKTVMSILKDTREDYCASGDTVAFVNFLYTEQETGEEESDPVFDSDGLQLLSDGKMQQLMRTKENNNVSNPLISGNYMIIRTDFTNEFHPMLYDLKKGEFISLDSIPKDRHSGCFVGKNAYFTSTQDGKFVLYCVKL